VLTPPAEHGGAVAAPAAMPFVAEHVVEQPEEGDAERVEHDKPELGAEHRLVDQMLEERARDQRERRRRDDDRARRVGQPDPAVVLVRELAVGERAQRRGGDHDGGEERERER